MSASLGVTVGLCLALTPALVAADRRIEGIVKSVDAEKFTITLSTKSGATVKDETLDVVKKARITVNGQPVTLQDVRRGQEVVAVFNTELEVVTRLDATGEGVAPLVPEITVVNELPGDGQHSGPWPTADGLTLYWKTQPGAGNDGAWIWSARRETKDDLFEDAMRLVPGSDMTVSTDGLEMVLLQRDGLYVTTRPSIETAFRRPQRLAELQGHGLLAVPCFSGNDLVLYAMKLEPPPSGGPVKFTRADRRAKWTGPTPVKVDLPAGKQVHMFSVTPDGSRAVCLLYDWSPREARRPFYESPNELAMMRAEGDGFGRPVTIRINGEPLQGIFPRYVAATNELFFVRRDDPKPAEIVLVRNFDPDAIEAESVATATPTRHDHEAMQGEWVSVSETIGGKTLTPEKHRQLNKRLSVQSDRFVIRSTGTQGKPGIDDGRIRLDPTAMPKRFDWEGKMPSGASGSVHGIYELDGDALRICYVETSSGKPRPTEMRSTEGNGGILIRFRRDKK